MSELVQKLRAEAVRDKPLAKLLGEAADVLEAAERRIFDLSGALRDLVEIGNSDRPRDMAEVKRTMARARAALAFRGSVVAAKDLKAPLGAGSGSGPSAKSGKSEQVVDEMFVEIQNILRDRPKAPAS